jgi:hypothetical protein
MVYTGGLRRASKTVRKKCALHFGIDGVVFVSRSLIFSNLTSSSFFKIFVNSSEIGKSLPILAGEIMFC